MSLQKRLQVLLLALLPLLLGTVFLYLLTRLNIVAKDPGPFDGRNFAATYQAEHGKLNIKSTDKRASYDLSGEVQGQMLVDTQGMANSPQPGKAFTPFWLHFFNPVLTLSTRNPSFSMVDNAGVLGETGTLYTARPEGSLILMDDILQSQASYKYGIFQQNGRRAATAIYDATCGLLFRLQVKHSQYPDLRLVQTDFPISRNRITLVIFYVLLSTLLVANLFIKAHRSTEDVDFIEFQRQAWLVLLGVLCIGVDTQLDIWQPFLLGHVWSVAIHCLLILPLLVWGKRAAIPALAELLMAAFLWIYLEGPVLPFFYIPGLTISYILLLGAFRQKEPLAGA